MNTDFSVRLSNTVQEFLAGKLAGKYKRSLQLIGNIDSFDSRWGYLKTCHFVPPRLKSSIAPVAILAEGFVSTTSDVMPLPLANCAKSIVVGEMVNGDLDDIVDDDSAFSSEVFQLKLFVCGSQHQERRRFANAHSASGAVPKRIRDLECPSPDEE